MRIDLKQGDCLEKAYAETVGMKVLSLKDLGVVINEHDTMGANNI